MGALDKRRPCKVARAGGAGGEAGGRPGAAGRRLAGCIWQKHGDDERYRLWGAPSGLHREGRNVLELASVLSWH